MKKIAVLIEGDLIDRKGQINASLSRIKHLKTIANYQIDIYAIQTYEGLLVRLLRKNNKRNRISSMFVDGMEIHLLWNRFSIINYLLVNKLKCKPLFQNRIKKKFSCLFKSYSLISAHSIGSGRLALSIHKMYGIPYYVTWHGSDIHTLPFASKHNFCDTVEVLETACNNFFVSKALMNTCDRITLNAKKQLLYNGVEKKYMQYDEEQKKVLKEKFGVNDEKIVAFVGNLFHIKNVLLLPKIFEKVKNSYNKDLLFWIIGDGKLRFELQQSLIEHGVKCKLWGNQPVEKMIDFMNAIDVLVLPSKNEGLPLVTVEALACGTNVVGSNVGGIKEVIGDENVFNLDSNFVNNISDRIVEMLDNKIEQSLSELFDWDKTAIIENDVYINELNKNNNE